MTHIIIDNEHFEKYMNQQTLFATNTPIRQYTPTPPLQRELEQMDYWELWCQHMLADGNVARQELVEWHISNLPIESRNQLRKLNRFKDASCTR